MFIVEHYVLLILVLTEKNGFAFLNVENIDCETYASSDFNVILKHAVKCISKQYFYFILFIYFLFFARTIWLYFSLHWIVLYFAIIFNAYKIMQLNNFNLQVRTNGNILLSHHFWINWINLDRRKAYAYYYWTFHRVISENVLGINKKNFRNNNNVIL